MYATTASYRASLAKQVQSWDISGILTTAAGTQIPINSDNIIADSFEINNQCTDSSDINVGGVYMSELSVTLFNLQQSIALADYRGSSIEFEIGLYSETNLSWDWVPLGTFWVAEATRVSFDQTTSQAAVQPYAVELKAYDAMYLLGKIPFEYSTSFKDVSPWYALQDIADAIGASVGIQRAELQNFANGEQSFCLDAWESEVKTWRDFLYCITQVICGFASFDRSGNLIVKPFDPQTAVAQIDIDDSISGSASVSDYTTLYGGFYIEDTDGNQIYYGRDPDLIAVQTASYQSEVDAIEDQIDGIDSQMASIQVTIRDVLPYQYSQGQITYKEFQSKLEEYTAQLDALQSEKSTLAQDIIEINAKITLWESKASQTYANSSTMDIGFSPLLNKRSQTAIIGGVTVEDLRWNMVTSINRMRYTPYQYDAVGYPGYDVGDRITLTYDDNAGSVSCMVMATSFDGNIQTLEGFGSRPELSNVSSRSERSTSSGLERINQVVNQITQVVEKQTTAIATTTELGQIKVGQGLAMDAGNHLRVTDGLVLSGTTVPSNDLGNNGDAYIRTNPQEIWYKGQGAWSKLSLGGGSSNIIDNTFISGDGNNAALADHTTITEVTS